MKKLFNKYFRPDNEILRGFLQGIIEMGALCFFIYLLFGYAYVFGDVKGWHLN